MAVSGDRQLVRNAIAAYFGGTQQTTPDGGVYYQGGPLSALGLGTVYPYRIKGSAPGTFYTQGTPAGFGWGAVMTVTLGEANGDRYSQQWRVRHYSAVCYLEGKSFEPQLTVSEEGFDDLIDAIQAMVWADPALGTTDQSAYPLTGRLITQAGEAAPSVGISGVKAAEPQWEAKERGMAWGGTTITFAADTFIVTPAPGGP